MNKIPMYQVILLFRQVRNQLEQEVLRHPKQVNHINKSN